MITVSKGNEILNLHDGIAPSSNQRSAIFISFHKCATSYFSNYILKNAVGLQHIDYLGYLYKNHVPVAPVLKTEGYIYGVIRLLDRDHPRYAFVSSLLANESFGKLRKIYWTRDPRDVLISSYYSFGFTHGFSDQEELANYQKARKEQYQNMTLDECVLEEALNLRTRYLQMKRLMEENQDYLHLKYEDMINNFDEFIEKLTEYIPIDQDAREKIFRDTRPSDHEEINRHNRKGSVGQYKEKLNMKTIEQLNLILNDVLVFFGYL